LLAIWWVLLGLQIWFAWELNEFYASCLPLLIAGPETPFALVGLVLGLVGLVGAFRRRAWPKFSAQVLTLIASAWLLADPPVLWLGASLHLWRNEDRYLAEIAAVRASLSPGAVRNDMPDRDKVFVEGQPPRFGFEQRWIGQFHWAAFVYDPDRTLEAQASGRADVFRYSLLGYDHLWGDWYLVWAIK
jgi:hypothetical protein